MPNPFSYAELLAAHQRAREVDPEVVPEDLPTFASSLNALTGTNNYDAGLVDNSTRRFAQGYQDATKWLGPEEGHILGEGINSLVDKVSPGAIKPDWMKVAPDALEGLGKIVPDMLVAKGVETAGKALRLPIPVPLTLSGLSGLRTYADTGSAAQAGTVAAATGASFGVAGVARNYALGKMGANTLGELAVQTTAGGQAAADALAKVSATEGGDAMAKIAGTLVPSTMKQWLIAHGVLNAAMLTTQQAGSAIQRIEADPEHRLSAAKPTAQELVTTLAGQLPYSLYEGYSQGRRPVSYEAKQIVEQSKKNFSQEYKDVAKATGNDPSSGDISAAYQRALRRAGLATDATILRSQQNEAYIDPDYALNLIGESRRAKQAESDRQRDLQLTIALKGEAVDVSKLSESEQQRYAELTSKTDRTPEEDDILNNLAEQGKVTGDVNPEIQRRVAEISGSPMERGTDPSKRNLIERFQNFQWLRDYDAKKARDQKGLSSNDAASIMRQTIDQVQQGKGKAKTDLFAPDPASVEDLQKTLTAAEEENPGDAQKAELIRQANELEDAGRFDEASKLYDQIEQGEQGTSSETGLRSSYNTLLPQQTAAAQRAALVYDPRAKFSNRRLGQEPAVDWQNPQEVRAFERYVYDAMSRAKTEAERERGGEETVSEHATQDEAELNARVLNDNKDPESGDMYGVPKRPNAQGKFVVKKYSNYRTTELIEGWKQDLESGGKMDFEDYLKDLESGNLFQGPIQARDAFNAHVSQIEKLTTVPAQREALYDSLTQNVLSAVRSMSSDDITKITGSRKNDKNIIGRRLARYMEFLHQGGKIDLEVAKEPKRKVLGIFANEQDAKNLVTNVSTDLLGAKTSLTLITHDLKAEDGTVLGKAHAVVQDNPQGGTVKSVRAKVDKVVPGQETDLDKLNAFLGDLGYAEGKDLNKRRDSKMNFFEQMNALGLAVGAKFQNPNDMFQRPPGEFGFDVGVIEGKGSKLSVYGQNSYAPTKQKANFAYDTRDGQRKLYTHDNPNIHPLLGLLSKLRQDQGTVDASVIGDMLLKMDDRDVPPDLKAALTLLTKREGSQKVKFGVALSRNSYGEWDPTVRGWYNYVQQNLQGGGGMLSPYYRDAKTGRVNWLKPEQLAMVLTHELVHANTSVGLWQDKSFRDEVQKVHDYVRDQYHLQQETHKLAGLEFPSLLGLGDGPERVDEFFAEMWTNPELRKFVWSLPDNPELFGVLPERSVKQTSIFHRFWSTIKSWMQKNMGSQSTSLAERVQMMQERAIMVQDVMGQVHDPKYDLYGSLSNVIYQPGDLIVSKSTMLVPKGVGIEHTIGGGEGGQVIRDPNAGAPMSDPKAEPNFGLPVGTSGQPKELFFEKGKEVSAVDKFNQEKALPDVQEPASTSLESRTIDPSTVRRALQYGASDWTDEQDGSWTFKPQHEGTGFLGWWGMDNGTDYHDNGERVSITPKGQERLTQMLATEQSRQTSRASLGGMPQFVSGFQTLQKIYENAGYTQRQSQQMATLMTRYLSAWKEPEKYTIGTLGTDSTVAGLAELGGTRSALSPTMVEGKGWRQHTGAAARNVKETLLHEAFHLGDKDSYLTQLAEVMTPEERSILLNVWHEIVGTNVAEDGNWEHAVNDPVEYSADMAARMYRGMAGSPSPSVVLKEYLTYFSDNVAFWLSDQFKTQHDVLTNFTDAAMGIGKDLGLLAKGTATFAKEMMRPVEQAEALTTQALQMRWLYPDSYYEAVENVNEAIEKNAHPNLAMRGADTDPSVLTSTAPAGTTVRGVLGLEANHKLSWWNKNLTRFHLLAKQYPDLQPVWNAIDVANRMAHEAVVKVKSVTIGATAANNVNPRIIRDNIKQFLRSNPMQDSFSKVALEIQILGEKGIDVTPAVRDQLLARYVPDDGERKTVNHVLQATIEQNKLVGKYIQNGHRTAAELVTAISARKYLQGAMDVNQAREFSSTMFKMFDASVSGRSQDALQAQQQLQMLVPNQKALVDLIGTGQDLYAHYDTTGNLDGGLMYEQGMLQQRGDWWMTERQFGNYGVYYRGGNGEMTSFWTKDMATRDKFAAGKPDVRLVDNDGADKNLGLNAGLLDRLSQADERLQQKLASVLSPEDFQALGLGSDIAGEMRAAMLAQDVSNTNIRRKHTSGRVFLSMYDNQQLYHSAALNALKNKQMKLETALALTNPVFGQQPDLKKTAIQHLSNVLTPDTEWGRRIQTANFTYFMLGNISSMVLEPFQQLMALAPALVESGDEVVGSYKRVATANKDVIAARLGKRYADPGLWAAVNQAKKEGVIDSGILEELDYHPDLNYVNSLRTLNQKNPYSLFDLLKNKAYVAANLGRQFYSIAPRFNSEVAFVSAFRQEMAKSGNRDQAYQFASNMTRNTMFGGGKIGRPVGLFSLGGGGVNSNWGRTAAQAMYSLQSYSSGMMTLMGEAAKNSFRPKGLTDAQVRQTRKAATLMFGTQFALAGALGMPFVGGALAALNQFVPTTNWDQEVRDLLTGWLPDDDGMGGFLQDFIAKGLPSATQHGPDMGSRFALGSTLGVSPYNGVGLENLFGPSVSLATNIVRAGQKALAGEPIKGAKDLLPSGLQRMLDSITQGKEFRNKQDELLLNDMTPAEQLGRAGGFTPNRAARIQDATNLARKAKSSRDARMDTKVDKWASEWVAGDVEKVRQEVLDAEVESKGQEKARDLIHAIANRVEKKTMLQDPRALGSRQTAQSMDSMLRLIQQGGQTVPTETERVMARDKVHTSLGLPSGLTRERVGRSSALDRLMEMNPALSRATAELALSHPSRSDPYSGAENYGREQEY